MQADIQPAPFFTGQPRIAPQARRHIPCMRLGVIDRKERIAGVAHELAARLRVGCLLYTSPSPRDRTRSRMPSSA